MRVAVLRHEFRFIEKQDRISPHIFVILVTFVYRLGHVFKTIRDKNLVENMVDFQLN